MNWEAIGAAGEFLGAIAVFVTLIYLAVQVRQSNRLTRFNATTELVNQFNDLNRLVSTDHALRKVLSKEKELSDDEREQVYNFAISFYVRRSSVVSDFVSTHGLETHRLSLHQTPIGTLWSEHLRLRVPETSPYPRSSIQRPTGFESSYLSVRESVRAQTENALRRSFNCDRRVAGRRGFFSL